MTKRRTINIEGIWSIKGQAPCGSKSIITIENEKHKINLHLSSYTINYFAEELWKIINERQKQVNSNESAMRGEDE